MDEAGKEHRKNLIRFQCGHCGQKIHVPAVHSGKKGKCPKCGQIVTVPEIPPPAPVEKPPSSITSGLDSLAFDVPPKQQPTIQPSQQSQAQQEDIDPYQMLRQTVLHKETKPPPERKLPWIIDIFLYPSTKPALTFLCVIIGIPFLMDILVEAIRFAMLSVPALLALFLFFIGLNFLLKFFMLLYLFWYFCECIRDSAEGALRAPETISRTPGLIELFCQLFKAAACLILFILPALIYLKYTKRTDTIFWALLGGGLFFSVMGMLAVIMFDSFAGLNPVLVVGSIFSTFFVYCALFIPIASFVYLAFRTAQYLRHSQFLDNLCSIFFIYLFLVLSHLLGRFYFRYRQKLNWDV